MNTRLIPILAAAAAILAGIPAVSSAQGDVDLMVTAVQASLVGNDLLVAAEITILDQGYAAPISTTVRYYLDGQPVGSGPFNMLTSLPSTCNMFSPPNCDYGYCEDKDTNGQPTAAACVQMIYYNTSMMGCGCVYLYLEPAHPLTYHDEMICSVAIDEEDSVAEADESNNMLAVSLEPVAERAESWSRLKATYR
ncbi:MAG: hypothetical protein AB7V45_06200 [Candidatus Krumholzibacteriia bacterium]